MIVGNRIAEDIVVFGAVADVNAVPLVGINRVVGNLGSVCLANLKADTAIPEDQIIAYLIGIVVLNVEAVPIVFFYSVALEDVVVAIILNADALFVAMKVIVAQRVVTRPENANAIPLVVICFIVFQQIIRRRNLWLVDIRTAGIEHKAVGQITAGIVVAIRDIVAEYKVVAAA